MAFAVPADAQALPQEFSSSREPRSHQVFLSHAGKQKPFVSDLYEDFVKWPGQSVDPFFDQSEESLPKGEEFPDRIFEAARTCVVAVVILTKEYVTSKWPMLELLAFVEAQKSDNPDLKLLPVFYDDLPTSSIDEHIVIDDSWVAKWEEMRRESDVASPQVPRMITITAESCKEALRKLRKTNGLVSTNYPSLRTLQHSIVEAALKFLPANSEMDTENIQGCLRLCKAISQMLLKNENGVHCLGLFGMGGLGKTTMCKALCSYFTDKVHRSEPVHRVCHLEIGSNHTDGREKEEMKFKRHIKILRELSDMSKDQIDKLENTHAEYSAEKCAHQCLNEKKLKFLAVDNVQDSLTSREEAGKYLKWLSPGSVIIITSRSRDNVLYVTQNPDFCKPIPILEEDEAMTLFLRIAARSEVTLPSLNELQRKILRNCMRICFFSPRTKKIHDGETGHYHPLALRAVASYLKDLSSGEDPFLHWEKVLRSEDRFFHARESIDIMEVLGIGFNDSDMCDLSKQLFIDVALFAPPENVFKWLVCIHECKPQKIQKMLKLLRSKCFLNDDGGTPLQESCENISMHELYREFANAYLKKEEGLFKFGVYDDGDLPLPSLEEPKWATVPRIRLRRLTNVAKVKEWHAVAVLQLYECEKITTFPIGELSSLSHLVIYGCPMLEVLSWTQDIVVKGDYESTKNWGEELRFVYLSENNRLRTLPDFNTCSKLQELRVKGCLSSVEPLRLHNCFNLEVLLMGDDAPEVLSLPSCPKLRLVMLPWKATHKGLPLLNQLPCLFKLTIRGSSDVPLEDMILMFSPLLGKQQFIKQHPKDTVCHDISVVGVLSNLERVCLTYIPLGKLPLELATVAGSSLQRLNLSGCLLSLSVDFSTFPNLHHLIIRWTNVEEIWGLERLTKLGYLDCSFCFELQKVPDLRPLSELRTVHFNQCPKLQGIPRLPPGCVPDGDSEDFKRVTLAAMAFAKTTAKPLPRPGFSIGKPPRSIPSQRNDGLAIHATVSCDGCMMFPLEGPRYVAKPVRTKYSLCSNCISDKCHRNKCSVTENMKPRWKVEGEWHANYDLCSSCYKTSGCDSKLFYKIDRTQKGLRTINNIGASDDRNGTLRNDRIILRIFLPSSNRILVKIRHVERYSI